MTQTDTTQTNSPTNHETPLAGKTAVVAAGAKNLGGLISTRLAGLGADVAVHYNSDSSRADAEKTQAAIAELGTKAILVQGDLTLPVNVTTLFDQAVDAFGGVDIAINTVGKVLRKPIVETTEDEYDDMFAINSKAAFFFLQEAGKRCNDDATIITIVTSLLAAYTDGYATYAGERARWSTSPAPRPRSSPILASGSTASHRVRWTPRSSTRKRRRSGWSSTSRRRSATD